MLTGVRGTLIDFTADPFVKDEENCIRVEADGLLVIENGKIAAVGPYERLIKTYPRCPVVHYPGRFIMPGFIDAHVHYSQVRIIGSYGAHLLDWLDTYVYGEEEVRRGAHQLQRNPRT